MSLSPFSLATTTALSLSWLFLFSHFQLESFFKKQRSFVERFGFRWATPHGGVKNMCERPSTNGSNYQTFGRQRAPLAVNANRTAKKETQAGITTVNHELKRFSFCGAVYHIQYLYCESSFCFVRPVTPNLSLV